MKKEEEPMNIGDIEILLTEASRISNHRRFVIAGSLCVVGAAINPPSEMTMSKDLDMYPQSDPERGFVEIFKKMSEGTDFHKTHGYYIDPITPKLLSLPEGWESRLITTTLHNSIIALFIDPNDAAVGKLARSNDNDLRWISAGLKNKILDYSVILNGIKNTSNLSSDERLNSRSSLEQIYADIDGISALNIEADNQDIPTPKG